MYKYMKKSFGPRCSTLASTMYSTQAVSELWSRKELNRFAENRPLVLVDFLHLSMVRSIHCPEILLKSGEVRQPCSQCWLEGRGQLKFHGHWDDRVRRTWVLLRSIQYPYLSHVCLFSVFPPFLTYLLMLYKQRKRGVSSYVLSIIAQW